VGREIRQLIVDMSKHGVTIFLTTHYMEEADQLCDRVAFLSEGRIVALDTPDNLKTVHGKHEVNVTLGNSESRTINLDDPDAGREIQQLMSSGQVRTLHSAEATLEEVFIELAGRRLAE
jgi:ABC-type multidrug transport system ATPase subunit